jgi:peroxiredoxin
MGRGTIPHMAISVGSKIPDVQIHVLGDDGMPKPVSSLEMLGKGKVVLFAVPGAFTPGCSKVHLPGFVQRFKDLKDKGVESVACISVNDPWVMDAWKRDQGADEIVMLADGTGAFTKAMGLELDGSGFGLGSRSQRYAAIINNGVVERLDVEEGGGITVSSCDMVITHL